jgi:hypothetical protein
MPLCRYDGWHRSQTKQNFMPGPIDANIIYLTAGAAGMYCGSCLHDNALAAALTDAGWNVQLVPTYTPIRTDESDVSGLFPFACMGGLFP